MGIIYRAKSLRSLRLQRKHQCSHLSSSWTRQIRREVWDEASDSKRARSESQPHLIRRTYKTRLDKDSAGVEASHNDVAVEYFETHREKAFLGGKGFEFHSPICIDDGGKTLFD